MNKISFLVLGLLLGVVFVQAQADIFSQYYQQARNIAEGMTIQQLAGQMIAADF